MAEPKTNWGQELKRDLALISQTVASLTSSVEKLDVTVGELAQDNSAGKTSTRILWALVLLLLGGSVVLQAWSGSNIKSEIASEGKAIATLTERATGLVETSNKHSDELAKITAATASQKDEIRGVREDLDKLKLQFTDIKSQVADAKSGVQNSVRDATEELKKSIAEVRTSADKAQTAADGALAAIRHSTEKPAPDVFTVQAELSLENLSKDKSPPKATAFTVGLGVPLRPDAVQRCEVSLVTSQRELQEMKAGTITLQASITKEGQATVVAWSSTAPMEDLISRQSLLVELSITVDANSTY